MDYQKLEYYLSQPRLNRFLTASNHSKSKAQKLYRINLRVSEAFYPVLNLFEIFLRNAMHNCISSYFSNPNWIITEKNGFMSHPSLTASKFFLKDCVNKAERTIQRKGGIITSGKVIAEQPLSFWTSLFDTHHYRLIGGSPIQCFVKKPPEVNRKVINQKLNRIREFRNRIYHNEPICFYDRTMSFSEALLIQQEIHELLEWIDGDLSEYVNYFNKIRSKIQLADYLIHDEG